MNETEVAIIARLNELAVGPDGETERCEINEAMGLLMDHKFKKLGWSDTRQV